MKERWKKVPGFEHYKVSDQGRVMSCRYGTGGGVKVGPWRLITPAYNGKRTHLQVDLVRESKKRVAFSIHRLLYELFVGPIPDGMVVDHADRNSLNNQLSNLRLATQSQNVANTKSRNKAGWPKGIRPTKNGKWEAKTSYKGKAVYLGRHATQEAAIEAFSKYVVETYGEFACVESANKDFN